MCVFQYLFENVPLPPSTPPPPPGCIIYTIFIIFSVYSINENNFLFQAIADTLDAMNWKQFTVIYETNAGLSRLQNVLAKHGPSGNPVTVRQLKNSVDISKEADYRPLLKEVANSTDYNIILDVEPEHLISVLAQAREVKLLSDYYNYIITGLVIDMSSFMF